MQRGEIWWATLNTWPPTRSRPRRGVWSLALKVVAVHRHCTYGRKAAVSRYAVFAHHRGLMGGRV